MNVVRRIVSFFTTERVTYGVFFVLSVLAFVAACAPKPTETVYVDTPAVSTEPTYTGKYK